MSKPTWIVWVVGGVFVVGGMFYRYVGRVCWFNHDGGAIVLDSFCGSGQVMYGGKWYELPQIPLPIPKELQ